MFRHILVPLDGSQLSELALPLAARIAKASGGVITLLHISNPTIEYGPYLSQPFSYSENVIESELESTESYLEQVAHSEVLKDCRIHKEAILGEIAQGILDFAHKHTTDLLVMCSHGRKGIKRWAMGSVAQKVARYSPKPVLVINGSQDMSLPITGAVPTRPISILVALDGSPLSETVLIPASQLCTTLNTSQQGGLHLLRVVELAEAMRDEAVEAIDEMNKHTIAEAKTYLQHVEQRFREGDLAMFHLTVTSSIAMGYDTADILVQEAEQGESCDNGSEDASCDILALATHGRGGIQRWVIGSVAERVLSSTKLPMLIVRSTKDTETQLS